MNETQSQRRKPRIEWDAVALLAAVFVPLIAIILGSFCEFAFPFMDGIKDSISHYMPIGMLDSYFKALQSIVLLAFGVCLVLYYRSHSPVTKWKLRARNISTAFLLLTIIAKFILAMLGISPY